MENQANLMRNVSQLFSRCFDNENKLYRMFLPIPSSIVFPRYPLGRRSSKFRYGNYPFNGLRKITPTQRVYSNVISVLRSILRRGFPIVPSLMGLLEVDVGNLIRPQRVTMTLRFLRVRVYPRRSHRAIVFHPRREVLTLVQVLGRRICVARFLPIPLTFTYERHANSGRQFERFGKSCMIHDLQVSSHAQGGHVRVVYMRLALGL